MTQVLHNSPLLTDTTAILIEGCLRQDSQSQELLYRLCYPDMIKICYRYAGDLDGAGIIFNNAMLRVFRHLNQYKDEGKLMAWIKTIVVNCCIDYARERSRFRNNQALDNGEEEHSIPPDVLDRVSAREIQQLIAQLPRATATVFNLFIYEGFSHRQISESLGIAEGTSKWHVNEGRRLLKESLRAFINH
jgi:RNA polymerase sigma-70 factor, ECF subfamily